ncbi:hypothetical protein [Nocardia sp. NPDC060249]|uniref:hypothetical protein n=1 Tax=Nocardia sp. NPDC060249 TaxID=3347082 RepID=UPI00364A42F2
MTSPIEVILQAGVSVAAAELGKLGGVRSRSQAIEAALSGQGTSTDPDYAKTLEQFQTMSHQQIYDAVHGAGGMDVAGLQTLGTVWQKASTELTTAAQSNAKDLARLLGNGEWSGSSGDAARAASQRVATVIDVVGQVFGAVGTRVEGLACAAEAVRAAVQAPRTLVTTLNPDDPMSSIIPGLVNPTTATDQRAEQDQALAATRAAMEQIYTPSYPPNGSGVPSYPVVQDALAGGDQSAAGGNGGTQGEGSPSSPSPATNGETAPAGADDDTATEEPSNVDGAQDDSTDPSGTDEDTTEQTEDSSGSPSESSPQTTAAGTQSGPLGAAGSPMSGTPGTGSPSSGLPGASLPGAGVPSTPNLGAPLPGVNAQPPSTSVAGSAGAGGGRASAHGPMGPMAPGAGQRRGGNDDEHQSPDYLRRVHDDWTEGINSRPAAVGADAPSALPVEHSDAPPARQAAVSAAPTTPASNSAAPVDNSRTPAEVPPSTSIPESVLESAVPIQVDQPEPTPAAGPPAEQQPAGLTPDVASLLSAYGWGASTPPPPAAPTERERP